MALHFAAAASDRVDCGSAAMLDDRGVGTTLFWVKPDTGVAGNPVQAICGKVGTGFVNVVMRQNGTRLRFDLNRTTADMILVADGFLAGRYNFGVVSWDAALTDTDQHLYIGTPNVPAIEPVYLTQTAGSGTQDVDSTGPFLIGNLEPTGTDVTQGNIAWLATYNRQLTLREIHRLQFNPQPAPGCLGDWIPGEFGTGIVHDRSGKGNYGTVTGATYVRAPELDAILMPKRRPLRAFADLFVPPPPTGAIVFNMQIG